MKLFWKVFFSIIMVTTVMFSLGGYTLISTVFNNSLQREITSAGEENDMLRVALLNAVQNYPHNGVLSSDMLYSLIKSLKVTTGSGELKFRVSNEQVTIFSSSNTGFNKDILDHINPGDRRYEIVHNDHGYFVITACIIELEGQDIYLESFRDITLIFKEKTNQYSVFQRLAIILIIINGIIIFFISLWITSPIKRLSSAAKEMAKGNFAKRVKIEGKDELAMLSNDFNFMASKIEENINEIKEAARREEDFTTAFAHELKTPLTSIIGYADMLRSKKMTDEQKFMAANYIFLEGKRLENLSFRLMDIIVLKKKGINPKMVKISELFEDVKKITGHILKEDKIKFSVSYDEDIINVESSLIKTVLVNLIDNARKAIDSNGEICLIGKKVGRLYGISVRDNGRGIPADEISKISEAFYMVDKSRSREKGGAGLGLALCSSIIKLHGSELNIESTINEGTVVTFFIKEAK